MGGILEAFLAGKEARRVADAAEQVNAMQAFIGQNGAAIMGGDANALGQLAGFGQQGLQMAMGIKGDISAQERQAQMDALMMEDRQYDRARQEKADARDDQQWEMQVAEYKKSISAEQAAAEAAELEEAAKMALTAQSPEQWDQLATENGAPELVGQFENREAVAARFMSVAEVLKAQEPEKIDPTTSQRDYMFYEQQERAAGRTPLSFNDWDLQSRKASATNVTTTVGGGTGDTATRPGQVFDEMKISADAAKSAVTGLRALEEASKALEGDAITGIGADWRLSAQKLGVLLGVADPKAVEDTETFRSAIAPQVAAMIKATVGSAQLSNADREFAEKAAGGSIDLDATSIKRLLGIMERAAKITIDTHNDRLNKVYPPGSADRERALFEVEIPKTATGGAPEVGMVEDGYRFKGGDPADPANWEQVE